MDKSRLRRRLLGEFSFRRIICSALFIYGFLLVYAMGWSDHIIFQPQSCSYKDTKEILKLTASDGVQISAIYLPNPAATYTLLYSHGNAEDLGDIRPALDEMVPMGFAIFAYDYHGYGTSQGKPSETNAYRDIDAAYEYLTQKLRVQSNRIIAFGRSVGTGPTVDLASRKPLAGLILESPFLTAFRTVTRIPILPFDKFRNSSKIHRVHCPTLVLHGRKDQVIPFRHGEKLYELANEPKRCLWVENATHDNVMWVAGKAYEKTLREFTELVCETQKKMLQREN